MKLLARIALSFALCLGLAQAQEIKSSPPTYTEGTWTPTISTDATVGTPAYTTQVGTYERQGRLVFARATVQLSGWTGSPTGNVLLTGLPITSSSTANDNGVCYVSRYGATGLAASNFGIMGTIGSSSTQILFWSNNNTGSTQVTAAQFGTTGFLIMICIYRA